MSKKVEALYDYDYETAGRRIHIIKGEVYSLVSKSNDDWWKVKRGAEKFYVPANYVAIIEQSPFDGTDMHSLGDSSVTITTDIPTHRHNGGCVNNGQKLDVLEPAIIHDDCSVDRCEDSSSSAHSSTGPALLRFDSQISECSDQPSPQLETSEIVEYANIDIINQMIAQRSLDYSKQQIPEEASDSADEDQFQSLSDQADSTTNLVTNREVASLESTNQSESQPENQAQQRESRVQTFRGWTEATDEIGQKTYVHNATGEKWFMAVDDTGKNYYYKEDSNQSLWELPELDSQGGLTGKNVPNSALVDQQKDGHLKTKFGDGKKKFKKQWNTSYIVAFENNLIFYKDEKAATSKKDSDIGSPEAIVQLHNASISWAGKELSNRKNVLQIVSGSSTYLLQHDDTMLMHQWQSVLSTKVRLYSNGSLSSPIEPNGVAQAVDSKSADKPRKNYNRFSRQGATKSVYTLYEGHEAQPSLGSVSEGPKGGIRERLRNFLNKRPTREVLEKKGILQAEFVFGSRLQFICDREGTTIPKFVERCIQAIEDRGLDFDGLYRLSGNLAEIQKLRYLVESKDEYSLVDYDVNVLTGSLKLFFRELKEPLIPFHLYDILADTFRETDAEKKVKLMKRHLASMPRVNLNTLKFLFAHLVRVHEHEEQNRMKTKNLAIIFGPTLMWPEKETSPLSVSMMSQNYVIEYILSNYNRLF